MLFTGKNNREYESPILIRRDELGMSMKELCEKAKCSYSTVYALAYGTTWPVNIKTYEIKPIVRRLCEILSMDVEDMFPMFFCKLRQTQDINPELYVSSYSLAISNDPIMEVQQKEFIKRVCKIPLSTRDKVFFIRNILLDEGYADIATDFSISRSRVEQIIKRNIRRVKYALEKRQ